MADAAGRRDNRRKMARTLLIVDDHKSFRETARRVLEAAGFDVVGDAADGESAIEAVTRLRPDVVLMDVQMPGISGFEVAARLTAEDGAPAIVMTSSRESADFGPLVEQSGARGFVHKADLSGPAIDALVA
jgi:DNA-binding NarL/FixJ family response regulator